MERYINPTVEEISIELDRYEAGKNKGVCAHTDTGVHLVGNVYEDENSQVVVNTVLGPRYPHSVKVYE